ncbi:SpoIIE family protein phosphatase [Roseiconus nitratireducens]|uniref:SpoIIE family protein phosphatase n=1 Tax=Roseiconus nitratireducens TaxID=2605748 RepID=A0A5M6D835_9BACT|nr:SpoIIE family protein phosphatase [Roseiconus nitratireducens]KAA5543687.1 SpoIIE family protein phosphatase [Roseiconus nitratireducens]
MNSYEDPDRSLSEHPRLLDDESDAYQLGLKNRALASSTEGITISDPSQPDNPIIYANEGFERLTGYKRTDVLGKNCRFLQGAETDQATVAELREAIRDERAVTVDLLNYRKDKSKFWNRLSITPVRNAEGKTTHFIGVQSDVTARVEAEQALRRTNARLHEASERMRNDLEVAARVQRSLLPTELPETDRLSIAWAFRPCDELAGDFLNVLQLDRRHIAFYVVDVSGHGVAASLLAVTIGRLLTSRVSTSSLLVRQRKGEASPRVIMPAEVAKELNRRFPIEEQNGLSFTMLYGVFDLETTKFRFVSAGHDPVVHLPTDGPPVLIEADGMTIGWMEDAEFSEQVVSLQPGDRLLMYSDGVPEAMNADLVPFSKERMLEVFTRDRTKSLHDSIASLDQAVDQWCQPTGPIDDVSILGLQVNDPKR